MKLSDARLSELEEEVRPDYYVQYDEYVKWEEIAALLAEVRSSRAALARIERAYNDPGRYPPLHERVKGFTRRDWPTLTAAIEAAIR